MSTYDDAVQALATAAVDSVRRAVQAGGTVEDQAKRAAQDVLLDLLGGDVHVKRGQHADYVSMAVIREVVGRIPSVTPTP